MSNYSPSLLFQLLEQHALEQPASLALSAAGQEFTYPALLEKARALAAHIEQHYAQSPLVFNLSHRGPTQIITLLASLLTQKPVAMLDIRQGSSRLEQILQQQSNAVIIADNLGQKTLEKLANVDHIPAIFYDPSKLADSLSVLQAGQSTNNGPALNTPAAIILFTSGSTGAPKGVCISKSDLESRFTTEKQWFDLAPQDNILGVLPLSFDVGLTQLLGTLYSGGHHILCSSWFPADILKSIDEYHIDGLALSPMVWHSLLQVKQPQELWSRLNKLRYLTLSGGSLPRQTLDHIQQHLNPGIFIKTYGQTEMFRISSLKPPYNVDKIYSVGTPYPGVVLKIEDETGNRCQPGIVGEVIALGMGMMSGYLNSTAESSQLTVIRTGDLGYIDDDDHLFICGRKDDMVKILDQRVFPEDAANTIREILGTSAVWVFTTTDTQPRLIGVIETGAVAENTTKEQLLTQLRKKMASHLVPSDLILLDEVPVTNTGKLDKVTILNYLT